MRDKARGRLLEVGAYAVAGAIAVGALGHCLFGACLSGPGSAQAAGAGPGKPAAGVTTAGAPGTTALLQLARPGKAASKAPAEAGRTLARDFEISGMYCAGCVTHISAVVRKLPGVKKVEIDLDSGRGTINYEEGKVDPARLVEAIKKAGYKAKPAG